MKNLSLFLFLLLGLPVLSHSQSKKSDNNNEKENETVFKFVDVMPEFPGGEDAMMNYIANHIVVPKEFQKKGKSGRVMANFIVGTDGRISKIKIVNSLGWGCNKAVTTMLKNMPAWKPGSIKGKPVRVSYSLPVVFKLEEE